MEQVIVSNENRFGRFSKKREDTNRIDFCEVDGRIIFSMKSKKVIVVCMPVKQMKIWLKQITKGVTSWKSGITISKCCNHQWKVC